MTGLNTTIVAPSSALGDAERLQQGIDLLRSWGHTINSAPDPTRHWGYYAGRDAERLADFAGEAELWACARGGWGAARLLEQGWQPPPGDGCWGSPMSPACCGLNKPPGSAEPSMARW